MTPGKCTPRRRGMRPRRRRSRANFFLIPMRPAGDRRRIPPYPKGPRGPLSISPINQPIDFAKCSYRPPPPFLVVGARKNFLRHPASGARGSSPPNGVESHRRLVFLAKTAVLVAQRRREILTPSLAPKMAGIQTLKPTFWYLQPHQVEARGRLVGRSWGTLGANIIEEESAKKRSFGASRAIGSRWLDRRRVSHTGPKLARAPARCAVALRRRWLCTHILRHVP